MEQRKILDWKQHFFDVKKIGPEPPLTKGGYWKKFKPVEIKAVSDRSLADRDAKAPKTSSN